MPMTSFFKTTPKALQQDESGVASIEFAFIAPVMLLMYFGLAEVATAISVDRRISQGANVAGDMITQAPETGKDDAEEILSAAVRVMNVRNANDIQIDIQSFIRDSAGDIESRGRLLFNHTSTPAPFDADSLDARLLSENSGIVVTRVTYEYTPIETTDSIQRKGTDDGATGDDYETDRFDGNITLSETYLLKPRRSELVDIVPMDVAGVKITDTKTICTGSGYSSIVCADPIPDPG